MSYNIFMWIKAVIILIVTTRLCCMPTVSTNSDISEIKNLRFENTKKGIPAVIKTFKVKNDYFNHNLKVNTENDNKISKPATVGIKKRSTDMEIKSALNKSIHKNENKFLVLTAKLNTNIDKSTFHKKSLNNNMINKIQQNIDTNLLGIKNNTSIKHGYVNQNTEVPNKQCNAQNSILSTDEIETAIKVLNTLLRKTKDSSEIESSRDLRNNKLENENVAMTEDSNCQSESDAIDDKTSELRNMITKVFLKDKIKDVNNTNYNLNILRNNLKESSINLTLSQIGKNISKIKNKMDVKSSKISEYPLNKTQSNINDKFVLDMPLTIENTTEMVDIDSKVDVTISSPESLNNSTEKSIKYDVENNIETTERNDTEIYENINDLSKLNQTDDCNNNFTVKPLTLNNKIQPSKLLDKNSSLEDIKVLKSEIESLHSENKIIPKESDTLISNHTSVNLLENSCSNHSSNANCKSVNNKSKVKIQTNQVETITSATNDDSIQKLTFRFHVPVDGIFKFNCTKNTISIKNGIAQFEIYIKKN